jgi:manganese/iron transport system ATP-binding protein
MTVLAHNLGRPASSDAGSGIAVKGATVTYRNGHTALRDASFKIPTGTIAALVGVNGSGKSTLFKAIMGFVRLAKGDIRVLGLPVDEALKKNLIAYVPQAEEVDWNFPVLVEDVVMMGRYGHMGMMRIPRAADHEAVATALARVNMSDFRERQIGELSGGQKKRVFLARALAQDGRVILLDEPFTGVDVKTEDQIITLLRELRDEGRVMLVSTHNLGSVPEFCDRTILIKGTILAYGPTVETFTQGNLEKAFGGVLRHFVLNEAQSGRPTPVGVFTDDERPLILQGGKATAREPDKGDGEPA